MDYASCTIDSAFVGVLIIGNSTSSYTKRSPGIRSVQVININLIGTFTDQFHITRLIVLQYVGNVWCSSVFDGDCVPISETPIFKVLITIIPHSAASH